MKPVAESMVILIAEVPVPVIYSTDMTRLIGFHIAGSDVPHLYGCLFTRAVHARSRSLHKLPSWWRTSLVRHETLSGEVDDDCHAGAKCLLL